MARKITIALLCLVVLFCSIFTNDAILVNAAETNNPYRADNNYFSKLELEEIINNEHSFELYFYYDLLSFGKLVSYQLQELYCDSLSVVLTCQYVTNDNGYLDLKVNKTTISGSVTNSVSSTSQNYTNTSTTPFILETNINMKSYILSDLYTNTYTNLQLQNRYSSLALNYILYDGSYNNPVKTMSLSMGTTPFGTTEVITESGLIEITNNLPHNQYKNNVLFTRDYIRDSEQGLSSYDNLMSSVFNGFSNILNTEVFPNITIGLIIGIPLLLGAFLIILKLIRG